MAKAYPEELARYIREHASEGSIMDMCEKVRERFGTDITYKAMKSYFGNHKIHAAPVKGRKRPELHKWPPQVEEYIRAHHKGVGPKEMAETLAEVFGGEFTRAELKAYYGRHKLNSGVTGYFQPGRVPHNKGTRPKDEILDKMRPTMFRKGNRPVNAVPVGTKVKIEGYWKIKIGEPNKWQQLNRYEWERIHGEKLKPNEVVLFLDNNSDNFSPDNLVKISRSELSLLNRDKMRTGNPEADMAAVNLARLESRINAAVRRKGEKNDNDKNNH